jgi:hypothetical protein
MTPKTKTLPPQDTNKPLQSGSSFGSLDEKGDDTFGSTFQTGESGAVVLMVKHEAALLVAESLREKTLADRAIFLKSTHLFESWSMTRLRQVAGLLQVKTFRPRETIFQQGSNAGDFYIIRLVFGIWDLGFGIWGHRGLDFGIKSSHVDF